MNTAFSPHYAVMNAGHEVSVFQWEGSHSSRFSRDITGFKGSVPINFIRTRIFPIFLFLIIIDFKFVATCDINMEKFNISTLIRSVTCSEFFDFISKYSKLIQQVDSPEKYKKLQVEEADTLAK